MSNDRQHDCEDCAPHIARYTTACDLLRHTSGGFGRLALSALPSFANRGEAATPSKLRRLSNPIVTKLPHFAARTKRVIFFMHGGPFGIDTFVPKPLLENELLEDTLVLGGDQFGRTPHRREERVKEILV